MWVFLEAPLSRFPHLVESLDVGAEVEKLVVERPAKDAHEEVSYAFLRARCYHIDSQFEAAARQYDLANNMLAQQHADGLKEIVAKCEQSLDWLKSVTPNLLVSETGSPSPLLILGPSRSWKDSLGLRSFIAKVVSVRCPPPNVRVFVALVSTMGSGHLGALYGGRAEEAALAG